MLNCTSNTVIQANSAFGKALIRTPLDPRFASVPLTRGVRLGLAADENSLALFRNGVCCRSRPLTRLVDTYRLSDVDVSNTAIRLENHVIRAAFPNAVMRSVWDIARGSRVKCADAIWAIAGWIWKDDVFPLDNCRVFFYRGGRGDYLGADVARVHGPTALLNIKFVRRFTCYAAFAEAMNVRAGTIASGRLS